MKQYPASKTQQRKLIELNLDCPAGYNDAGALLEAHGWDRSGSKETGIVVSEQPAPATHESWYQRSKRYHAQQREQMDEEDADRRDFRRAGF